MQGASKDLFNIAIYHALPCLLHVVLASFNIVYKLPSLCAYVLYHSWRARASMTRLISLGACTHSPTIIKERINLCGS